MKTKGIDRREFTLQACKALLAGVAITVSGCDDAPTGPTPEGDVLADISNRHGHVAVITRAQLTAARALVLDIRGSAGHGHTVSLTQDDVAHIAAGGQVVKTSSTSGLHEHTVTFN